MAELMTIGALSERTGVPVKQLRRYEDLGYIYTVGRSAGNYRLFDEEALWCVGMVTTFRSLGLTLAEISEIVEAYLSEPDRNAGPLLAEKLEGVRNRTRAQIEELGDLLTWIDGFETDNRALLAGEADIRASDPRFGADQP